MFWILTSWGRGAVVLSIRARERRVGGGFRHFESALAEIAGSLGYRLTRQALLARPLVDLVRDFSRQRTMAPNWVAKLVAATVCAAFALPPPVASKTAVAFFAKLDGCAAGSLSAPSVVTIRVRAMSLMSNDFRAAGRRWRKFRS